MDKRQTLTAFLEAWKDGDFDKMYPLCQNRWKENHSITDLEEMYQDMGLKGYKIFSETYVSSAAHKFNVDLSLLNGYKIISVALVICEDEQGKPVGYGTWGVNPVSVQNVISKIAPKKKKKSDEAKD